MALGGKGVISVAANVVPREMHELTQLCLENRFLEAGTLQLKLHELIRALFCEVNPIPVKAAMELLGLCSGELRLPAAVPHFRASFGTALQCAKAVPSLGISDSYFSFMQYSSCIHFVFT